MQPLRAISYKALSVTFLVVMASLIKASAASVPPGQMVFFRSFFAIPVILVWLVYTGHLNDGLTTKDPMKHVWRGLLGTTGMALSFTALGLLPLPEVTAIGYAAPVLVVIFAAMFLGERVRIFRLSAVALGLLGVLIVLSPRISTLGGEQDLRQTLGAVVALAAAFVSALAQVFVRSMVRTESTTAIVFYFSVTSSVMALLTLPWGWVWPAPAVTLMLVSAGILGGIGQILLTASYKYADVSVIAPFEYTSMLLALLIGYFVFSEIPTWTTIGGAALVILAGVLVILREHQLGLDRRNQRAARGPEG
ncbi:DMT family transporter [Frigidibacter sp. ROC022]|uniref:DMT family transporter n=1 Tax=Frigidibacter sp. ROC022 TaxID=2971796 RepID=UPI00215ABEEF|nr:DMT family transporter [Frigidibacter sp. ROC022]MCR8724758.1 DMT family transporter [Frigidibacter sp. ROC022]